MNWLKEAAAVAGYISAIAGVTALLLINPLKGFAQKRKEKKRRAEEEAARKETAARKAEEEFRQEMRDALKEIKDKLEAVNDDIGDLQYERLSQAHDFYTERGWCPSSKKQQLCVMHKSYRDKGRNHLSERFEEDILGLDDKPQGMSGSDYRVDM